MTRLEQNLLCFKIKRKLINKNISVFLEDKHIYIYDIRLSIQLTARQWAIRYDLCKASEIYLQN